MQQGLLIKNAIWHLATWYHITCHLHLITVVVDNGVRTAIIYQYNDCRPPPPGQKKEKEKET